MPGGQQINTAQGTLTAEGGEAEGEALVGSQGTLSPGISVPLSLVPLRSRKVGGGAATHSLSGLFAALAQGEFNKERLRAIAGAAATAQQGNFPARLRNRALTGRVATFAQGPVTASGTGAPPPPPPPVTTSDFPQYYITDDGAYGPTAKYWNKELTLWWPSHWNTIVEETDPARNPTSPWWEGDWTNRDGTPNVNTNPWATFPPITPTTAINQWISIDITALAQRWQTTGHNRGCYIHRGATGNLSSFAEFHGRLNTNPPELVITTTTGTFTFRPGYAARWNSSSANGIDCRTIWRVNSGDRACLHFRDVLETLTGTITSATIRLFLANRHASTTITPVIHETNIPFTHVGGAGATPTMGIASEVGESGLPSHPDVYLAGDLRQSNFITHIDDAGNLSCDPRDPAPLADLGGFPSPGTQPNLPIEYYDDPEAPGTTALRTGWYGDPALTGTRVANSFSTRLNHRHLKPDLSDPLLPIDPSTTIEEMYVRAYLMLEEDVLEIDDIAYGNVEQHGIKWGLGFELRPGFWAGANWDGTRTGGNSGQAGHGIRFIAEQGQFGGNLPPARQWAYSGHSIRGHVEACDATGTVFQNFRPFKTMCSHLGPWKDSFPYNAGSEEIIQCGDTVLRKGQWHCHEWRIKLNSIVGPFDADGNGVGVRDGIMQLWVDGVLRWTKSDLVWRRHPHFGVMGYWMVALMGGTKGPASGQFCHYRMNHLVQAKRYIGPHPGRISGSPPPPPPPPPPSLPYSLPSVGEAKAISLNFPEDVKPDTWTDNRWQYSLFASENAWVYVPQYSGAGAVVMAGTGGHNHPDFTGAALFNLQTALWERLDNQNGVPTDYPFDTYPYPETDPPFHPLAFDVDRHTDLNTSIPSGPERPYEVHYNNIQYPVPAPGHPFFSLALDPRGPKGGLFYLSRCAVGWQSRNTAVGHHLDLDTMLWRRTLGGNAAIVSVEGDILWDEDRGIYWHIPSNAHAHRRVPFFDPANEEWGETDPPMSTVPPGVISATAGEYRPRTFLHEGLLIRICGLNGIYCWDPDVPTTAWFQLNLTGVPLDMQILNQWAPYSDGCWYYVSGDASSNQLFRLQPPSGNLKTGTWTCSVVTLSGTALPPRSDNSNPPTVPELHYGRLKYASGIDCLVWIPGADSPVVIFKPPAL